MRKSSILCSYTMARCRQAPYKIASEMGLEPLQISTCYKMALDSDFLQNDAERNRAKIGPGGQPFHRGIFDGDIYIYIYIHKMFGHFDGEKRGNMTINHG